MWISWPPCHKLYLRAVCICEFTWFLWLLPTSHIRASLQIIDFPVFLRLFWYDNYFFVDSRIFCENSDFPHASEFIQLRSAGKSCCERAWYLPRCNYGWGWVWAHNTAGVYICERICVHVCGAYVIACVSVCVWDSGWDFVCEIPCVRFCVSACECVCVWYMVCMCDVIRVFTTSFVSFIIILFFCFLYSSYLFIFSLLEPWTNTFVLV